MANRPYHKQLLSQVGTAFSLVMVLAGLFTFRADYASVGIGLMGAGVVFLLAIVFLVLRSYRLEAEAARVASSPPDHKLELGRANLRRPLEDIPKISAAGPHVDDVYNWYQIVEEIVAAVCGQSAVDDLQMAWKGPLGAAGYSSESNPGRVFIWQQEQVRPFLDICSE